MHEAVVRPPLLIPPPTKKVSPTLTVRQLSNKIRKDLNTSEFTDSDVAELLAPELVRMSVKVRGRTRTIWTPRRHHTDLSTAEREGVASIHPRSVLIGSCWALLVELQAEQHLREKRERSRRGFLSEEQFAALRDSGLV